MENEKEKTNHYLWDSYKFILLITILLNANDNTM